LKFLASITSQALKAKYLKEIVLKITYDDGTNKKANCPHFTGKGGIEENYSTLWKI